MEDTLKHMIYAFVLMSLFGLLIVTAIVDVSNEYDKDTSDVLGDDFSIATFNESISSLETTSQNLKTRFENEAPWSAIAGIVVTGIFGIARDMWSLILLPFKVLQDVLVNVLHVPSYVVSIILGLLIISFMLAVWRLLKIGD